jgi:hypothetical protein
MTYSTTEQAQEALVALAAQFEERFDKRSDIYQGYKSARQYIDAYEPALGIGGLAWSLKEGKIPVSTEEKQQLLALAQFCASTNDEVALSSLEDVRGIVTAEEPTTR